MGAGLSKKGKKKDRPSNLQAAKPLTAVSEGDEHAWSSVHIEDDNSDGVFKSTVPAKRSPLRTEKKQVAEPAPDVVIKVVDELPKPPSRLPTASSVEEKEDYSSHQQVSSNDEQQQDDEPAHKISITVTDDEPSSSRPESIPLSSDSQPESTTYSEDTSAMVVSAATMQEEPEVLASPPPREATPDPLQEGGYLIFSTHNDGALFLVFSHHKVDDAIAYFRPKRIVPAFKFRQNHGRVELIRKLMNNKQGYYEGYADFLKAAKEFDSEVYIINHQVARVYYQPEGSTVAEAIPATFFSTRVNQICVIPPNNTSFEGVKSLSPDQFVSTGNKYGKALKF